MALFIACGTLLSVVQRRAPVLIDTHKTVRDLTDVGIPQEQAERLVDVVTRADDKVATKADLDALEERLRSAIEGMATKASVERLGADLENARAALDEKASLADLAALEERLGRSMWRTAFASAGLTASLVAALLAAFRFPA